MKNMTTRRVGARELPTIFLVEIFVPFWCVLLFVYFCCDMQNLLVCRDILTFATLFLSNECLL